MNNKKTIIYAADASCFRNEKLYYAAYDSASYSRQMRTDRYLRARDRYLSLGAETLLRFALSEWYNEKIKPECGIGMNGKPFLLNRDVKFNLSHSEDYVICALSENEVGCDIEKIKSGDLGIAERFFAQEEYERIISCKGIEEKTDLFFRFWTLKESFMKATGFGMKTRFDNFVIRLDNEISVEQKISRSKFFFKEFDCVEGYKCALCCTDCTPADKLLFADLEEILEREKK